MKLDKCCSGGTLCINSEIPSILIMGRNQLYQLNASFIPICDHGGAYSIYPLYEIQSVLLCSRNRGYLFIHG